MKTEILSPQQLDRLHAASLEILDRTGLQVPHAEVRRLFAEAGARVNEAVQLVHIPAEVVDRCLKSAGRSFTIFGRDPARQARFGVGARNYNSSAGQALWLNEASSERRYASLQDVEVAARVGDSLPRLTMVGAMADPHELPVSYRSVEVAATLFKNTTKPVFFWFHDRPSARFIVELLTVLSGTDRAAARRPMALAFLEPISPLKFPFNGLDLLFETSRLELPVAIGPMAQMGASAPCSLAGTLAQENAEVLAGLCAVQLIRPGLPVCHGGIPHAFDMRTTQIIFGGPEQALMAVAMTQLAHRYGLPAYINVGLTDSKTVDAQAGLEAGITLFAGTLAGADIFGHLGICGADQGASLTMLLMQHEIIEYLERFFRGIAVDDELLGLDVLHSVGPGGSFLAEEHTARHFRQELWMPRLLDRQFWGGWMQSGARTMAQRCEEMKNELLRKSQPAPLDVSLAGEVDRIVTAARRELAP